MTGLNEHGATNQVRASVLAALRDEDPHADPLVRICRACVALLPVDGVSVSVISGTQHRETLYTSDEVIARVESVQFTLGEGPCFEAFTHRRPVLVPDLAHARSGHWPAFAPEIADQPIAAIYAFPLQSGAVTVGAMDMYRREAGLLSISQLAIALRVVDLAAVALIGPLSERYPSEIELEQLAPRRQTRAEVHQATGMLISQLGIPPGEALARLRGYAFATGRLVEDVARDIVTRRLVLDTSDI